MLLHFLVCNVSAPLQGRDYANCSRKFHDAAAGASDVGVVNHSQPPVAIDTLRDMEDLYADIDLGTVSTSMTINGPAATLHRSPPCTGTHLHDRPVTRHVTQSSRKTRFGNAFF